MGWGDAGGKDDEEKEEGAEEFFMRNKRLAMIWWLGTRKDGNWQFESA